jgi:antitoxin component of MazEF toxin-antitoxin module
MNGFHKWPLSQIQCELHEIDYKRVVELEAVIRKGGVLELPSSILSELGLGEGKKVALSVREGEILIKPVKSITEELTDSIKLDDVNLIEEIIDSEDWL